MGISLEIQQLVIDIELGEEGGGEEEGEEGEEFGHFAEEVNTHGIGSEEQPLLTTGGQEESIQTQGWCMGSVSSPPLLRLRCSGEPQPAHSPILTPRPSSPKHTFGSVAVSTEANESVDNGDSSSSSSVCIAALPALAGNIKVRHGFASGVSTNSRISRQESCSNTATGTIFPGS